MKTIQKLAFVLTGLIAMVAINACSSDEPAVVDGQESNEKNSVEELIDGAFLTAVARGDASIYIYALSDSVRLEQKISDSKKSISGSWEPCHIEGVWYRFPSYRITKGLTMEPVDLGAWPLDVGNPSIIDYPWKKYIAETGFDILILVSSKFEYNPEKKTVTLPLGEWEVLQAKENQLTVCNIIFDGQDSPAGDKGFDQIRIRASYACEPLAISEDEYKCYGSQNEAKIAMVKLMRAYYGDVVQLVEEDLYWLGSAHHPLHDYPVIDLAALQDDLENGRGEWHSWSIAHNYKW